MRKNMDVRKHALLFGDMFCYNLNVLHIHENSFYASIEIRWELLLEDKDAFTLVYDSLSHETSEQRAYQCPLAKDFQGHTYNRTS